MPAPEVDMQSKGQRPAIGHVNLMVDTLIANATIDDLRAIVRSVLATSPPTVTTTFVNAARHRLGQNAQKSLVKQSMLFEKRLGDDLGHTHSTSARYRIIPTRTLTSLLSHTRSLYGAGMGFDSLDLLTTIVRAMTDLRWDPDDNFADVLAVIDADISQAIQSCKEELASGHTRDIVTARTSLRKLRAAMEDCRAEVETWGGEYPFVRGSANADCLQL